MGSNRISMIHAIDDWYANLPLIKTKVFGIVWRIEPEMDWMMDFDTKIKTWRVYSRFGVIENEG